MRRTDDPAGRWSFAELRPHHLAGFVESIWHFEGAIANARERHLPNGLFELVVQLGDGFHYENDGMRQRCPAACVAGLQTGSTVIEAPPRSCVLGMRLYPAGAYAVIGSPLHESTGRLVDLDDLVGRASRDLVQRTLDSPDAESRVLGAARWIAARIARSRGIDPRVVWSAARIDRSHGIVSIARIQEQTGFSKKRLLQIFREQIGVTPKLYARIVRLRRALTLLHEGGRSPADIAAVAGYYDQPHMNLDFRELAGLAPGDFLAATRYSPTTIAG